MTTYQKTLIAYAKGQKSLAFLAYKNDPSANKIFNFNQFCAAFDNLIKQHEINLPINPITNKKELPIWA
jgi:hypothetical protein